ncbi:phage holin family protein [Anaerosacchariphilus polymeriproducens]|uniref:Holin n=1 Tax=Anaerosacchariphilus polymeriproducens TaxID=1812858 RepID=A0A371AT88_9FIRM|nr:phage holin family protein [Anaerosacchariphilus polymeriproducens]RDU22752.1 holin [Anaerosacchariphilus polymeriproducens]
MEKINSFKIILLTAFGVAGSGLSKLLGGFDMTLQILIVLMIADYVTGLIVAGVFKKSGKTETGALESRAGWKGLCRKGMVLLIVLVATQLDKVTGIDFIRNTVILGYVANEAISITENAGLMGVPLPGVLTNAINVLKQKAESEE